MWLQGVALAPGQIPKTFSNTNYPLAGAAALGVDSRSGILYHGATVGLEFAF
jgi:hypothetical protein